MFAPDDLDDVFTEAAQMVEIADKQVTQLNGWATLVDASYRPVRLGSQFHHEPSPGAKHTHLLVTDEARARDSVTVVQVRTADPAATP